MKQYFPIVPVIISLTLQCIGGQHDEDRPYDLQPLEGVFGAEVRGILLKDVKRGRNDSIIDHFVRDLRKYRALIVRDQGVMVGDDQVDVTRWFGEANCIQADHRKSPSQCIYRLANEKREGITGRGRQWHVDGSYREVCDTAVIYHVQHAPDRGGTLFLPMKECVDRLSEEKRSEYERLFYRLQDMVFPTLVVHPYTEDVIFRPHFFHIRDYIWDHGTEEERIVKAKKERNRIFKEMEDHFDETCKDLIYQHMWVPGDFVITDNMALAHKADENATKPSDEIGLRILHRSSAYALRAAYPAQGYVKKAERREQYLKYKNDLEKESASRTVDMVRWCPKDDVDLCGENGELAKLFDVNPDDNNEIRDTPNMDILDKDIASENDEKVTDNMFARDEF